MPLDRSLYIIPNETPVCQLDAAGAFQNLTETERKYAHYLAKASFEGALAVFLQVSPESPAIFYVLYKLFKSEPLEQLKTKALNIGFTESEWEALLVYAAAFYSNSGNYKGFGDTKIVPGLEESKIRALLEQSVVGNDKRVMETWKQVEKVIGSLESNELQLGFGDKVSESGERRIDKGIGGFVDK